MSPEGTDIFSLRGLQSKIPGKWESPRSGLLIIRTRESPVESSATFCSVPSDDSPSMTRISKSKPGTCCCNRDVSDASIKASSFRVARSTDTVGLASESLIFVMSKRSAKHQNSDGRIINSPESIVAYN